MSEVFADTSYFVALLGKDVREGELALRVTAGRDDSLVTTAWVLVELGNFLSAAGHRAEFIETVRLLENDNNAIVLPPDTRLFDAGLHLYTQRLDKDWSLTDCISFVVMQERAIVEALTTDHHFQ